MKIFEKIVVIFIIFIMIFSSNYGVIAATYEVLKDAITKDDGEELDILEQYEDYGDEKNIYNIQDSIKDESSEKSDGQVIENDEIKKEEIDNINKSEENIENNNETSSNNESDKDNEESAKEEQEYENKIENNINEETEQKVLDEVKENENIINDEVITQDQTVELEELQETEDDDPLQESRTTNNVNNISSKFRRTARAKPIEDISALINRFEVDGTSAIGIDVSKYQANINWAEVAASGVKFAIIRCRI